MLGLGRWGDALRRSTILAIAGFLLAWAGEPAEATTDSEPEGRVFEMVTQPDKPARRLGRPGTTIHLASPGLPSPDGNAVIHQQFAHTAATPEFSYPYDYTVSRRDPDEGWTTESIAPRRPQGALLTGLLNLFGWARDFRTTAWTSSWPLVTDENPLGSPAEPPFNYTRFSDARGFKAWITDPSQSLSTSVNHAHFSADGHMMYRVGYFRGILGPSDPSLQQLPGTGGATGGNQTVYRQDLETGEIILVNECSGQGESATLIPERLTNGKLSVQACEKGNVVERRGASLGGGDVGHGSTNLLSGSAENALSVDGRTAYFLSPDPASAFTVAACSLASGITRCPPQLYIRTQGPGGEEIVRWISRPEIEGQDATLLGRGVQFEGTTPDAKVVYFATNAVLTQDDPNGADAQTPGGVITGTASMNSWDLFRYELPAESGASPDTGTLTRITGGPDGTADPNTKCSTVSGSNCGQVIGGVVRYFSDDGKRVYFVTASPIEGADNEPPNGSSSENMPASGASNPRVNITSRNLYLYDDSKAGSAKWKFIANLPFPNAAGATLDGCASNYAIAGGLHSAGYNEPGTEAVNCFRGTRSGDLVVFQTSGRLTADDDAAHDVYVYDAEQDRLVRVTKPPAGEEPYDCSWQAGSGGAPATVNAVCNGELGSRWAVGIPPAAAVTRQMNVTDEGEVFFESGLMLDPDNDVNGSHMDVYAWKDGELSLISPGNADHDAYFSGNTVDGKSVFIQTSQPLDPYREVDSGDFDIYVARKGGGFPPPEEPIPCSLMDDDCQRSSSADGDPAAPATGSFSGPGNRMEAAPCQGNVKLRRLVSQARSLGARRTRLIKASLNQKTQRRARLRRIRAVDRRLRSVRKQSRLVRRDIHQCQARRGGGK